MGHLEKRIAEAEAKIREEEARLDEIRFRPVAPLEISKDGPCVVEIIFIPMTDFSSAPEPVKYCLPEGTQIIAIIHHVRDNFPAVAEKWDDLQITRGVAFVDVDSEYVSRSVLGSREELTF